MGAPLDIVVIGLSLRSAWGNGHSTTYRALLGALQARGDRVLFLERDVPWYAQNQDAASDLPGRLALYASLDELCDRHADDVANADLVIVGSYVPQGIEVGRWAQRTARGIVAFYDIDTPVTLAALAQGRCGYLDAQTIAGYDLYLSFSGGPALETLQERHGAQVAVPLYCSADPKRYFPEEREAAYDLGYMGTYSDDRQPVLDRLLLQPARTWNDGRFVVAGPQYPETVGWPPNVERIEHLPPSEHRAFYNRQRFTLNVTRADMVAMGFSPSVRLFEAAACGTPIVSDPWTGLDALFEPDKEILIAHSGAQVAHWLQRIPDPMRRRIGHAARARFLAEHTPAHRAQSLHTYFERAAAWRSRTTPPRLSGNRRTSHEPSFVPPDHRS
ncbi:CgeB family protein [Lysobacter auxotrophicus]|uniref:Glycosyltransferase n=1 Tax=Lysobacter auxotrophicus TaxID=2992573 RepID=A0ABN6UI56_9GAMM|nr:glycosyltransferase [Lysobacter auxotrophicus]BDU15998.1 glycosyltransferase [Lysobacter auxotrophicus]